MRCRHAAKRRGYILSKSRQRDPLGTDYGKWYLSLPDGIVQTFDSIQDLEPLLGGYIYNKQQ